MMTKRAIVLFDGEWKGIDVACSGGETYEELQNKAIKHLKHEKEKKEEERRIKQNEIAMWQLENGILPFSEI